MNICVTCATHPAVSICLCNWPIKQLFCPEDLPKHKATPSASFPHRDMPVALLDVLNTKEDFDVFLRRVQRFESVKHDLGEKIVKANEWARGLDLICEQAINKIREFHANNRQKLEVYCRDLTEQVNVAMKELERIMKEPGSEAYDALVASCWKFISEQSTNFAPELNLEGESEGFMRAARKKIGELSNELGNVRFEKWIMPRPAEAAKPIIPNPGEFALAITSGGISSWLPRDKSARAYASGPNSDWLSSLHSKISLCTLLCCLPMFMCWPIVGLCQSRDYYSTRPATFSTKIKSLILCLLPTLTCCFGAAINRTRQRRDSLIEGSFLLDLSFYCLGVWNTCLLLQEMDQKNK